MIDRAEVEEQALAVLQPRDGNLASVPAGLVEAGVVNAAARRLRRERHEYPLLPDHVARRRTGAAAVEHEVPFAVQALPVLATQLRPRIPVRVAGIVVHEQLWYGVTEGHTRWRCNGRSGGGYRRLRRYRISN